MRAREASQHVYPNSTKSHLYFGQAPGRLGFAQEIHGTTRTGRGIITARKAPIFPMGIVGQKPIRKTKWWPPPQQWTADNRSATEWLVFHALDLILGPEGLLWAYQVPEAGGRRIAGGAVIDFVIYNQRPPIAIRVQTERFHLGAGYLKMQSDFAQRSRLVRSGYVVIDIFDKTILPTKETGSGALYWVRQAIAGIQAPSPFTQRSGVHR